MENQKPHTEIVHQTPESEPILESRKKDVHDTDIQDELIIIGVGASAGGLEALQEFISKLPDDLSNFCIVIAQHLSPTYKSMLVPLISRETPLRVIEVHSGLKPETRNIYITPPDSEITLYKGKFLLSKPTAQIGPKPSVDVLFHSIANEKGAKSVGIILSGTGSDGSNGIRSIKSAGGLTIAQEPNTAKYDGMPLAALESGAVDLVLSPDKIGEELREFLSSGVVPTQSTASIIESQGNLDKIFQLLSSRTGTDFSNYKPSTICRRLEKRLTSLNFESLDDYLKFIESNPKEIDSLFNMILIGVTTFFRDTEAFEQLEKVLANIIASKPPGASIRIWITGCATGEEPYSIAILLSKLLREKINDYSIHIFATDIDENAIAHARKGLYHESALEKVPKDIVERYFLKKGNEYELLKSIRQLVLFSKHDVTSNPPFLKLDLISCRNLMIYFGTNLQRHIIPVFHYALNPEGFLFLGKSETVGLFSDLFTAVDGKYKIFQRKRGASLNSIKFSAFKPQKLLQPQVAIRKSKQDFSVSDMMKETLFATFEHPYVIVNDTMEIQEISGDIRLYLSLSPGVMNASILKMANNDIQVELRSVLSKAIRERIAVKSTIRKIQYFSNDYFVRINVRPLLFSNVNTDLFAVIFEKIDAEELKLYPRLEADNLDSENPKMIELEHELSATREHLQTFIEELETANEELQSLNEELQSANEELQSSNEELETSNEELQSTNEEIQVAYAEIRSVNEALERNQILLSQAQSNVNALLNNTLQSFLLIDKSYTIITFNAVAQETSKAMIGREMKSGDSIIDFILPQNLGEFHAQFTKAIAGQKVSGEREMILLSGESRYFIYNFTPVVSEGMGEDTNVISYSLLDITNIKKTEMLLAEKETLVHAVFDSTDIAMTISDDNGVLLRVNHGFSMLVGYPEKEMIGKSIALSVIDIEKNDYLVSYKDCLQGIPEQREWTIERHGGGKISAQVTRSLLPQASGKKYVLSIFRDITETRRKRELMRIIESKNQAGAWIFDSITSSITLTDFVYSIHEIAPAVPISIETAMKYYSFESLQNLAALLRKTLTTGEDFEFQTTMTTELGTIQTVYIYGQPIYSGTTISGILGIIKKVHPF